MVLPSASRLVVDEHLSDGVADLHELSLASGELVLSREEAQDLVFDVLERGVPLVVGVAEVLDLGHANLPDAQQASPGRDLVVEAEADLGGGEG